MTYSIHIYKRPNNWWCVAVSGTRDTRTSPSATRWRSLVYKKYYWDFPLFCEISILKVVIPASLNMIYIKCK